MISSLCLLSFLTYNCLLFLIIKTNSLTIFPIKMRIVTRPLRKRNENETPVNVFKM